MSVLARIRAYAADSPFVITSVVVGNVQYPAEVADAVSRKLAATQELQRKDTEIEIERKERTKREVQAQGIANAMQIIRGQLSAMYIQHEAIEAQKAMVNSPNHTVVYIPVGPMGVPITGTFPTDGADDSVCGNAIRDDQQRSLAETRFTTETRSNGRSTEGTPHRFGRPLGRPMRERRQRLPPDDARSAHRCGAIPCDARAVTCRASVVLRCTAAP